MVIGTKPLRTVHVLELLFLGRLNLKLMLLLAWILWLFFWIFLLSLIQFALWV